MGNRILRVSRWHALSIASRTLKSSKATGPIRRRFDFSLMRVRGLPRAEVAEDVLYDVRFIKQTDEPQTVVLLTVRAANQQICEKILRVNFLQLKAAFCPP